MKDNLSFDRNELDKLNRYFKENFKEICCNAFCVRKPFAELRLYTYLVYVINRI